MKCKRVVDDGFGYICANFSTRRREVKLFFVCQKNNFNAQRRDGGDVAMVVAGTIVG